MAALDDFKQSLVMQIDTETNRKIVDGVGFEHPVASGSLFSLSTNAQIKWLGLYTFRDVYDYGADPPKVRTKDDLIEYTFVNAADVATAATTAMGTVRTLLAAGRSAKDGVIDATTMNAAQAAFDTYMA